MKEHYQKRNDLIKKLEKILSKKATIETENSTIQIKKGLTCWGTLQVRSPEDVAIDIRGISPKQARAIARILTE